MTGNKFVLSFNAVKDLLNLGQVWNDYEDEKTRKANKALKVRQWIKDKTVGYKHLHQALKDNPRRIAFNYKVIMEKKPLDFMK